MPPGNDSFNYPLQSLRASAAAVRKTIWTCTEMDSDGYVVPKPGRKHELAKAIGQLRESMTDVHRQGLTSRLVRALETVAAATKRALEGGWRIPADRREILTICLHMLDAELKYDRIRVLRGKRLAQITDLCGWPEAVQCDVLDLVACYLNGYNINSYRHEVIDDLIAEHPDETTIDHSSPGDSNLLLMFTDLSDCESAGESNASARGDLRSDDFELHNPRIGSVRATEQEIAEALGLRPECEADLYELRDVLYQGREEGLLRRIRQGRWIVLNYIPKPRAGPDPELLLREVQELLGAEVKHNGKLKRPAHTLLEAIEQRPEPVSSKGDLGGIRQRRAALDRLFPGIRRCFVISGREITFMMDRFRLHVRRADPDEHL